MPLIHLGANSVYLSTVMISSTIVVWGISWNTEQSRMTSEVNMIISLFIWNTMSNTGISINERAFDEAINAGLAQVWLMLQNEIVKITPRDINRIDMNKPIDRKDGKRPKRRSHYKPKQIFGHWYEWVSGNLKRSVSFEVDESRKRVEVGTLADGPAQNYWKYLEYGTARMQARPFLRPTIADKKVQAMLVSEFERTFYAVLERYNRS